MQRSLFLSGILAGSLVTLFPFQSNQDFSYALLLLALVFVGFIIPITIHILGKNIPNTNMDKQEYCLQIIALCYILF